MRFWPGTGGLLESAAHLSLSGVQSTTFSNNAAERALRSGVIGRKNFNGTRSKRGEIVTATLYSLLESARIAGISPRDYLVAVATHDIPHPGKPLLPVDYLAALAG